MDFKEIGCEFAQWMFVLGRVQWREFLSTMMNLCI